MEFLDGNANLCIEKKKEGKSVLSEFDMVNANNSSS